MILISEELEEIFKMCSRVGVLCDGELMGVRDIHETDFNEIGKLMSGERNEAVSYTHLDVYKRQVLTPPFVITRLVVQSGSCCNAFRTAMAMGMPLAPLMPMIKRFFNVKSSCRPPFLGRFFCIYHKTVWLLYVKGKYKFTYSDSVESSSL